MADKDLCPCGSGKAYGECCEPIIKGTVKAPTAESLMRARYSSYVKQEIPFIISSCEEGEKIAEIDRKATEEWSKKSTWHGLRILRTEKGGENDEEGVVNGEWLYSVGNVKPMTVVREGEKIGRNDPCPYGSGKKYKKCCGR